MTDSWDAHREGRAGWGFVCGLLTASLAVALTRPSVAQSELVLPPSHAAVEGSGATNVPFGRSVPMRVQMAYDSILFAGAATITEIGFRLDGAASALGKQVDLEVRLSTMAFGVPAIQPFFATNRGINESVVFTRKVVQLPAAATQSPAPFLVRLPLDSTFVYDPDAGSLLVELIVHGQQPGTFSLDATFVCSSTFESFGPPGCGLQLSVPSTQVTWGGPAFVQLSGAQPGGLTGLVLGSVESGTWGGMALPLDLTPIGATGCYLSTNVLVGFAVSADSAGVATYRLQIPAMPGLQSQWLRFQGIAADPVANPLGVVTSRAGKVEICGWEPVSRVYATSLGANSGFREIGVAPVLQLTKQ